MKLSDYIKIYRDKHSLSQRQFAIICDLSNGYISMLEKNLNPKTGLPPVPSLMVLKKIADATGITIDELFAQIDDLPVEISGSGVASDNILSLPATRPLPLIGDIACGTPVLACENYETMIEADINIHADFCLRCKGDSMINDRIYDGDIVFIRQQHDVESGEIAAVLIDDEATLKRVLKYEKKVVFRAGNPLYADIIPSNGQKIRIIGKAIAFTSII